MTDSKKTKQGIELDVIKIPPHTNGQPEKKAIVIGENSSHEDPVQVFEIPEDSQRQDEAAQAISPAKSRSNLFIISICLLVLAGAVAFFFWQSSTRSLNSKNDFLMPIDRLCIKIEDSSLKLHESVQTIETMSATMGSKSKIKQVIETIDTARVYLSEFTSNIKKFHQYTHKDAPGKTDEIETYLIETSNFFLTDDYKHYIHILSEYLDVFNRYLTYYYNNYDEIKNKHPAKIKSTEVLYIKYKQATNLYHNADAINRANIKLLLEKFPKAARFFPRDQKGSIFRWTN